MYTYKCVYTRICVEALEATLARSRLAFSLKYIVIYTITRITNKTNKTNNNNNNKTNKLIIIIIIIYNILNSTLHYSGYDNNIHITKLVLHTLEYPRKP